MDDDTCKMRMNLAALKKVDPYANDIMDKSPHVAFYTFDSERNEWAKTDVEGAFFVYSRNGQPYHSIFINNRLNTNSFVEPVTGQLELQSQPPFLLYRNERSRIRGFWFYNSEECERIAKVLKNLVEHYAANGGNNSGSVSGGSATSGSGASGCGDNDGDLSSITSENIPCTNGGPVHVLQRQNSSSSSNIKINGNNISNNNNSTPNGKIPHKAVIEDNFKEDGPLNLFNMLSKAQQEFANSQNAAAMMVFPTGPSEVPSSVPSHSMQGQENLIGNQTTNNISSGSVLKFFASAKPKSGVEQQQSSASSSVLPMSVEEIERMQRTQTPVANVAATGLQSSSVNAFLQQVNTTPIIQNLTATDKLILANIRQQQQHFLQQQQQQQQLQQQQQQQQQHNLLQASSSSPIPSIADIEVAKFHKLMKQASMLGDSVSGGLAPATLDEVESQLRNLYTKENQTSAINIPLPPLVPTASIQGQEGGPLTLSLPQESSSVLSVLNSKDYPSNNKPALIPPTMFEISKNTDNVAFVATNSISLAEPLSRPINLQDLLNPTQLAQALIYLIQNDQDFVQKLHEAYVKVSTKSLVDTLH